MVGPHSMGISIEKLRQSPGCDSGKPRRRTGRPGAGPGRPHVRVLGLSALLFFVTTPQAPPLLFAQGILPPGAQQPVTSIVSSEGREFVGAFNAASDRTRLVLVFSPT